MSLALKFKKQLLVDTGEDRKRAVVHLTDGQSVEIEVSNADPFPTTIEGKNGVIQVTSRFSTNLLRLPKSTSDMVWLDFRGEEKNIPKFSSISIAMNLVAQSSYDGLACLEAGADLYVTPRRPYDHLKYYVGTIKAFSLV